MKKIRLLLVNSLNLLFNYIWGNEFPESLNQASIVSIFKKDDLNDCDNYRDSSLINVGIKLITKILTKRISEYGFSNNLIRPDQFGFLTKEECICFFYLYVRNLQTSSILQ